MAIGRKMTDEEVDELMMLKYIREELDEKDRIKNAKFAYFYKANKYFYTFIKIVASLIIALLGIASCTKSISVVTIPFASLTLLDIIVSIAAMALAWFFFKKLNELLAERKPDHAKSNNYEKAKQTLPEIKQIIEQQREKT